MQVRPNKALVSKTMELSFEMRRNNILTNTRLVQLIIADYPFLSDCDEVS